MYNIHNNIASSRNVYMMGEVLWERGQCKQCEKADIHCNLFHKYIKKLKWQDRHNGSPWRPEGLRSLHTQTQQMPLCQWPSFTVLYM